MPHRNEDGYPELTPDEESRMCDDFLAGRSLDGLAIEYELPEQEIVYTIKQCLIERGYDTYSEIIPVLRRAVDDPSGTGIGSSLARRAG